MLRYLRSRQCKYINILCPDQRRAKALRHSRERIELTGKLMVPGNGQKLSRWSLATHRKLILLSTSLSLLNIEMAFDLRVTNFRKMLEQPNYFLDWFRGSYVEANMEDSGHMLAEFLDEVPKIRAMLKML